MLLVGLGSRLQVTPPRLACTHCDWRGRQACRCVTIIDFPIIDDPAISIIDQPTGQHYVLASTTAPENERKLRNRRYDTPTMDAQKPK